MQTDGSWVNVVGGILAIVISPFLITALWVFSRDWGIRGKKIEDCVGGISLLAEKFTDFTSEALRDHVEIKTHLQQQSFILIGIDGENGIRGDVKRHSQRIDDIEHRNLAIDAIAEIESRQYKGPEKRHDVRRIRDHLLPHIPPVDQGEGEE